MDARVMSFGVLLSALVAAIVVASRSSSPRSCRLDARRASIRPSRSAASRPAVWPRHVTF
jgi:hypothetical protein